MDIKKQGAEYVYEFAKKVIDQTGPRLPGSEEEEKGAAIIAEEMKNITGVDAKVEEFKLAPLASIASIPCLGWAGFIAGLTYFISPIIALIISAGALLYGIAQIFTYSGIFDKLWVQHTSRNVYSEVLPEGGEYDYTIMFSGHNDSSWLWKHSLKNPKTAILKTALGIVGILAVIIISAIQTAKGNILSWTTSFSIGSVVMAVIIALTLISSALLGNYLTWNKKVASPGAMDNLTGVGFSIFMAKYFKENPDKMPSRCRIICAGLGSEEAGLKGSMAFVKAHKDEEWLKKTYVVNLDSIRDFDHFNVVKGDLWLFSHFDKELIEAAVESMKDAGHTAGIMVNPIGGCDSTPFCRAGVKTVTMIAQDPNITDYYHTSNDTYQNLDMRTLEDFTAALISMTDKIAALENKNK